MKVVVRRNFTSRLKAAGRSVRCDAFRSGELDHERLGVFRRDSDNADVAGFIRSLDDPLTRDRETRRGTYAPAKLHRLVFSLRQDHWDAAGLTSWRPVIRETIAEFERQRGSRLEWVAADLRGITLRILERERERHQRELAVEREIERARQRAERESAAPWSRPRASRTTRRHPRRRTVGGARGRWIGAGNQSEG